MKAYIKSRVLQDMRLYSEKIIRNNQGIYKMDMPEKDIIAGMPHRVSRHENCGASGLTVLNLIHRTRLRPLRYSHPQAILP